MEAKDVMTPDPVTVSPEHGVRHVAQIMLENRIGGLPVLDDIGRLVGIVTDGDLLRRAEIGMHGFASAKPSGSDGDERARDYVRAHADRVADIMTREPLTADEAMPLGQIAALMAERHINRVPVMRGDRLVGIVSRMDLLHAIATATLDEVAHGDEAIRCGVLARIKADAGVQGTNLTVTVTNRVVHLWGTVTSTSGRDAARVAAESVRGVDGVVDRLQTVDSLGDAARLTAAEGTSAAGGEHGAIAPDAREGGRK